MHALGNNPGRSPPLCPYLLRTCLYACVPVRVCLFCAVLSINSVIQLLISCPAEAVGTRKELLVATRHILATDFRRGFFAHIDVLLDEKVGVGW